MDEGLQVFADEAEDLLKLAENALLVLDDADSASEIGECVNDLFRTFHTIKGSAGLFGLDRVVGFTHVVESLLSKIREENSEVSDDMISLFLKSRDHLEVLVVIALEGTDPSAELEASEIELVSELKKYLGVVDQKPEELPSLTEESVNSTEQEEDVVENKCWHISLRFGVDSFRNGMDPSSFIKYLTTIGEIKRIVVVDDAVPDWTDLNAEDCYLGFEIDLMAPDTTKGELEEVFEFVEDDCKIAILPPNSHISKYIKMIEDLPEGDDRLGEILVSCGALTEREREEILTVQDRLVDESIGAEQPQSPPLLGQVAVENKVIQEPVVEAAVNKQKAKESASQQTIKVKADKLESLVNLVGELVIGAANSELNARRFDDAKLNEAMENLSRLVGEVRDTALGLRMVQIGETFSRFKRVVREVSKDLGKNIDLNINGAETELDKTLVEKISDPLMHLVRNSIDHGIESPEERLSLGKPETGVVTLSAFHESGSIVIQIVDDGRGLSKEKIYAKALEKDLIHEGQQLTDQEIYRLIFEAGFSTADSVTNLSGRGVGMDVVRRNIEALRGQIELDSEPGKGTNMSIKLPLTLAIIDGFQVRVGDTQYIVPLDMVEECIELNAETASQSNGNENYINLRDEILPYVYLNEYFGTDKDVGSSDRNNVVVVQFAGKKAGFVVDELLGEHQTVIKPLGKIFQNLTGISGATILGSGEVAMIIDIPELIQKFEKYHEYSAQNAQALH